MFSFRVCFVLRFGVIGLGIWEIYGFHSRMFLFRDFNSLVKACKYLGFHCSNVNTWDTWCFHCFHCSTVIFFSYIAYVSSLQHKVWKILSQTHKIVHIRLCLVASIMSQLLCMYCFLDFVGFYVFVCDLWLSVLSMECETSLHVFWVWDLNHFWIVSVN